MKQTAVEWLFDKIEEIEFIDPAAGQFYQEVMSLKEQAKAKERSQKAEEYLKGFKDGKEYQIKLDELTFKSE